jgi:hypothetical protein
MASWRLWFRIHTYALLLELRIFPNMELCDESLDYTPFGFTDIWKGDYHGEPVCIKVIRGIEKNSVRLETIRKMCGNFFDQGPADPAPYKTSRRGRNPISHPNVLPIIDVSETPSPLHIMSPWMPDGNITQYTQTNPSANRLMLVRTYQLEAR